MNRLDRLGIAIPLLRTKSLVKRASEQQPARSAAQLSKTVKGINSVSKRRLVLEKCRVNTPKIRLKSNEIRLTFFAFVCG